jgi:phenylalanyl-tRNA synthetase beta chain
VKLGDRFIRSTLERLEFRLEPEGRGRWLVTAPTFRADMELENDLVEELARFFGYERIPATLPPSRTAGTHARASRDEAAVRRLLLGLGFTEAINLSFGDVSDGARFAPAVEVGPRVAVANPLTEETAFMRTSLAAGLVRATRHNFNHGSRTVRLFEIGKIYGLAGDAPRERTMVGLAATGDFAGRNWLHPEGAYTFYDLKGTVAALLDGLRSEPWQVVPESGVPWLEPSSAARLEIEGEPAGVLGVLHSELAAEYKFKQEVLLAELDFDALARYGGRPLAYEPLPRYPAVERDLSVVVGADMAYATIRSGVAALGIPQLVSLDLVDVYEGAGIPAGKRSLTLRLVFQDRLRTLTVDQVQAFSDNVVTFLRDSCGAELR